jgi:hypothetical protein
MYTKKITNNANFTMMTIAPGIDDPFLNARSTYATAYSPQDNKVISNNCTV